MKKIAIIIFLTALYGFVYGQNDNYSTLNKFNHMYYNPGYAGDGNEIEAKVLNRNQWMGFEGQPNTFNFNIDMPFTLLGHRHGVALVIAQDQIAFFSNTSLNISYAYRKTLMQGELGIGAGLNMINNSLDDNWLTPDDGATVDDDFIPMNASNEPLAFDLNLGVFYRTDNLYLSISGKNLFSSRLKYVSESQTQDSDPFYTYGAQFFINTGYDYQLSNPLFAIQPSLFVASDFASTQWSLAGLLTYNQRFFGGLAYKQTDAISVIGGVDLPSGINVAVSYDITTSRIINNSTGSFEFMLGYSFSLDIDKDNRKYKSVRFL